MGVFEHPKHMFGPWLQYHDETVAHLDLCYDKFFYCILYSSINNKYNLSLPLLFKSILWLSCIMGRWPSVWNKLLY